MKIVTVNASKSYQILIENGILKYAGKYIKKISEKSRICIVTDDNVDSLYSKALENSLKEYGFNFIKFVIPNGEASKNSSNLIALL